MIVEVKLLGNLYRFAGTHYVTVRIGGVSSCTVREILRRCGIPEGEVGVIIMDGRSIVLDYVIRDGAELTILPALHGG